MIIDTKSVPYVRLFVTSASGAVPSELTPAVTEPAGDGVFNLIRPSSDSVPNFGSLVLTGAGAAGNTGVAKVYLWHRLGSLWFPTLVLDLSFILGSATGVAGGLVANTDHFAKTITATTDIDKNKAITSPDTTSGIAKVDFDLAGASKLQVQLGNGNATNYNALLRTYS